MNIGKSLRIAMAARETTQVELAEQLGWSRPKVKRILTNQHGNTKTVSILSTHFGLKPADFIGLADIL